MDFFWLIPERLAGGSRPGGHRLPLRHSDQTLVRDLTHLHAAGIRAVLTLTVRPLPAEPLLESRLRFIHLPVRDFSAPTQAQLATAVAWIDARLDAGMPTLVHCGGGRGRTGTVLAAWLIARGLTVEEAVAEVGAVRRGGVETHGQRAALRRFAQAGAQDERPTGAVP